MKLYVESLLPVDPATAWQIFESPEFEQRLEPHSWQGSWAPRYPDTW